MADEPSTPKPPPSPPSDNGDRLDRSPDRLVEAKTTAKRRISDKQLENLRRGRETRAAKAKAKLEPQAPEPPAPEPPAPEPPAPDPKVKAKHKPRAEPQPKTQTTPVVMEPTLNFSVF